MAYLCIIIAIVSTPQLERVSRNVGRGTACICFLKVTSHSPTDASVN